MADIEDFRVLEYLDPKPARHIRFAEAEVQGMDMHVAAVDETGGIKIGADDIAHGLAIDHLDLVAHAARNGHLIERLQLWNVRRLPGGLHVAEFQVAADAVFFDAIADDPLSAPAQVPDEVLRLGPSVLPNCLSIALSPESEPVICPPLRLDAPQPMTLASSSATETPRSRVPPPLHAREAAADDGDVDLDPLVEPREGRNLVAGRGIVGVAIGLAIDLFRA